MYVHCDELYGVHGIEAGLGLAFFSFNPPLLRIHTTSIPWTPYNPGQHIFRYKTSNLILHYCCLFKINLHETYLLSSLFLVPLDL